MEGKEVRRDNVSFGSLVASPKAKSEPSSCVWCPRPICRAHAIIAAAFACLPFRQSSAVALPRNRASNSCCSWPYKAPFAVVECFQKMLGTIYAREKDLSSFPGSRIQHSAFRNIKVTFKPIVERLRSRARRNIRRTFAFSLTFLNPECSSDQRIVTLAPSRIVPWARSKAAIALT